MIVYKVCILSVLHLYAGINVLSVQALSPLKVQLQHWLVQGLEMGYEALHGWV